MATDTPVSDLIVNKLTYSQWKSAKDGGTLSNTETYDLTDKDTAFVHTSGAETIAGVKTFSATPVGTKPAASNSTSDTKIPTIGWVNDSSTATNVVHRNGNETIAGTKTIQDFSLVVKSTETDDEASSIAATREYGILIQDKNGSRIGNFYGGQITNGKLRTYMCACRPVNGSNIYKYAEIQQSTDGTGHFNISCDTTQAPTPATSDNSTKIATTAFVKAQGYIGSANLVTCHVVIETYVNGTSWYRIYDDGWVEQGGSGSSGTITLLKSFINSNYTITTRMLSGSGNISWGEYGENTNKTTTTFTVGTKLVSWYACGKGA